MQADFAAQYGDLEQWHWWFRGRRRVLEGVLRHELASPKSRNILSVGCGPAPGLEWLVPFTGRCGTVVGLDIDSVHARNLPDRTAFVAGSLENAPLMDDAFDVVIAMDVLEHLDNDSAGLREAVRLTRPGGLLLITVPALPSLWGSQDVVSEHRRRYTKKSLTQLLDKEGLSAYQLNYFNVFLFPLAAGVRWYRRALGANGRSRSDFEDNHPGPVNDLLALVFGAERHFINVVPAPIGVSLLAKYRVPLERSL